MEHITETPKARQTWLGLKRLFIAALLISVSAPAWATSLTVALYPYVPRVEQFQTAITKAWEAANPDVDLVFLPTDQWDGGYSMDPPADADVYVFDAMYLALFNAQQNLVPFAEGEITNIGDFLPYAINGAKSGDSYLAIPLLGCANILFYQKDDAELAAATTLSDVAKTLNQCTYTSLIPPDRRGIMLDMAGGTTNATLYLDVDHAENGAYPLPQPQPDALNQTAIGSMRALLATASYYNALDETSDAYQRSAWFSQGYGRSVVGFTESMSEMSDESLSNIAFKVMPLSDNPDNPPLFYSDMIAVNSTTAERGTTDLAKQLANVMAETDTVVASFSGTAASPSPQYLMPARSSVFAAMSPAYPIYGQMEQLTKTNPVLFALDANGRDWVNAVKATIKSETRSNYQCGCDYAAGQPIPSNAAAPAICNPACEPHGGWNGNWTNQPPATGSVCQCNSCPAPTDAMAARLNGKSAPMSAAPSARPRPVKP
jgi:thiamine pyridinylase